MGCRRVRARFCAEGHLADRDRLRQRRRGGRYRSGRDRVQRARRPVGLDRRAHPHADARHREEPAGPDRPGPPRPAGGHDRSGSRARRRSVGVGGIWPHRPPRRDRRVGARHERARLRPVHQRGRGLPAGRVGRGVRRFRRDLVACPGGRRDSSHDQRRLARGDEARRVHRQLRPWRPGRSRGAARGTGVRPGGRRRARCHRSRTAARGSSAAAASTA